ncbi:DUF3370 family protein [Synechococcus sp. CS-1328]|uniref:DUF3370 family protein n=1 Tax=Synechococcus sp. CS-1328 TaxID=2847976 RepID=UPI0028804CE3|nr:DUF3370 family protein [Synechococcus sp. CS-1328]
MQLVSVLPAVSAVLLASSVLLQAPAASAYVALMAGQRARPLNGTFNNVPVLHSNQPEEVEGPGILITTTPGRSIAAETGQALRNSEFSFNGDFGLHIHHKYFPPNRKNISPQDRRAQLTLAAILINPGVRPVHIRFANGAVRNSFEAPYLANNLMGVKPLGPRPWNTGPGDATAVQMLRGRLDRNLADEITIPARSRVVLFNTALPALGIANALLRGHSDGPFQVAVVAAKDPNSDRDILAMLDQGRLAPGRVYLNRIADIQNRQIFSRVGGVALGDAYKANLRHDLSSQGPLHVPLTSTFRHHFGTSDVQVNALATRMIDSSLDNVGTYGVRFDIDLQLTGNGPYELVMSHPSPSGGRDFTAFRGSLQVTTADGLQEMHVGLRSGQSLSLTTLNLHPGVVNSVRVSLVYPADATPGHLLSVVPSSQLALVQERERQLELARSTVTRPNAPPPAVPPAVATNGAAATPAPTLQPAQPQLPRPVVAQPRPVVAPGAHHWVPPAPPLPPINHSVSPSRSAAAATIQPKSNPAAARVVPPSNIRSATATPVPVVLPPVRVSQSLIERYQDAVEAQQQIMRGLVGR